MVKVESFKCETCGKIYQTEEECKVCEDKCGKICNIIYDLEFSDEECGTLQFNYESWDKILNDRNKDVFYLDVSRVAMNEEQLDNLISKLQEIKDVYRNKLINSRIDKNIKNTY